ncbi:MAG TPA: undecaprenyl-phosphate galactose phosphotransferase WbaP, partial [Bryobacteraceae bacterium]|nr:undecaprenyl-phosphate galactose phosphotransferase WbaP [Bryobacteraceae bacterium]
YAMLGLYPGVGLSPVEELRRTVLGTTIVYLVGSACIVLLRETDFSRGVLLAGWASSVMLVPLMRSALKSCCASRQWWGVPVLVLGAGLAGRRVVSSLRAQPELGLKPVAFLQDEEGPEAEYSGIPVAGPLSMAVDLGRRLKVHHALVAMPNLKREELLSLLERMGAVFSHVIVIPDLFGMSSLWVSTRDLGGELGLEVRQNLLIPMNAWLKRALDLLVASLAVLLTWPLVALAALWIKWASPGPAFFRQDRGGEGGRSIRVWKLRTMHLNADRLLERHLESNPDARREWQRYFKLKADPRLLPVIGRLLRRTSLDEIPQLWNVIQGEMSLVGPRPFPRYHLEQFDADFRKLRARVLPGLTGLWQVSARSDGDLRVQQALDTYYIRNWSLWLDLHILARTIRAVLFHRGAY